MASGATNGSPAVGTPGGGGLVRLRKLERTSRLLPLTYSAGLSGLLSSLAAVGAGFAVSPTPA